MITEYNQTNETLFLESDMGTYRTDMSPTNEVLLVQCSNPVLNVERITEDHDDVASSSEENELFSSFRDFSCKCAEQAQHLNCRIFIEDLLLPNWSRVHNVAHSEITCSLCRAALNQACKKHPGVLKTHIFSQEGTASPIGPEEEVLKHERDKV